LECTISGSFRKFLPEIEAKIKECLKNEIKVLSPKVTEVREEINGFVFLTNDSGSIKNIEISHLHAIRNSDFLYVVNPNGYIGPSVTLEIGYAVAHSIPVFASEEPTEYILSQFISEIQQSIEKIKNNLKRQELPDIPRHASLLDLQAYINKMVHKRNFEDESLRDVVLLLIEEVGELAKAVRREIGLMIDLSKVGDYKSISNELADCLIYLMIIANLVDINLEEALRKKEEINKTKRWGKS